MAENPPQVPQLDRITRHILIEKPRVTKFQITWEDASSLMSSGMGNENDLNSMNMQQQQQQYMQQQEEGLLQPGTQFKDRNDMMSTANLQAAASFFGGAQ